jgi:N4-(beta-N-acetylglucosaminyl)-L-asparaginase
MTFTRRDFFATAAISSACAAIGSRADAEPLPLSATPDHGQDHASHNHPKPVRPTVPKLPVVLCKVTGTVGIDAAYTMLKQGRDTLEAALNVTTAQEDDPDDHSNGLGGLPNEDGEVQLDACCLHGPTRRGAAVAAVSGVRNAALLARAVMELTDYPLLAGSDAQRFALAQGFAKQDLVTEQSRLFWAAWKEIRASPEPLGPLIYDPLWPEPLRKAHFLSASQRDLDMLVHRFERVAAKLGIGPQWTWRATYEALFPAAEPLYVATANDQQQISSAATTSGLPWRLGGATSDIAMLGAGCYLDPEVGSAGSSGQGAANIRIAGAHTIVENMRRGMSPEEAGMDALRRIVRWYGNDLTALRFVEMVYYILRKDGAYGCVSLWHGDRTGHVRQFTVHDGVRRSEECKFLLEGSPPNGCRACPSP